MSDFFNTGLSRQQFLEQYWQKKPLLIRQAFPDIQKQVFISPEELAGLACDPEIESRLIKELGVGGQVWEVTPGPLSDAIFEKLPETHWTLLVQDMDKHIPELQTILDPFRFIPDWRRDDLMVSYATEFGSVGPHTDGYDVFLLQALGTRRWQIGGHPIEKPSLIEGLDLKILADFSVEQVWDLEPGDVLYLPPNFAHHGVALTQCMTFSVGFRASTEVDILDALVNTLAANGLGKKHYQDTGLIPKLGAEIDEQVLARIMRMLHQVIDESEPLLASTFGRLVTETKPSLLNLAEETCCDLPTLSEISKHYTQGDVLYKNLYCRFAWVKSSQGGELFMAGESYSVDQQGIALLPLLIEREQLIKSDWKQLKQNASVVKVLCELIAEGGWFWSKE